MKKNNVYMDEREREVYVDRISNGVYGVLCRHSRAGSCYSHPSMNRMTFKSLGGAQERLDEYAKDAGWKLIGAAG